MGRLTMLCRLQDGLGRCGAPAANPSCNAFLRAGGTIAPAKSGIDTQDRAPLPTVQCQLATPVRPADQFALGWLGAERARRVR